MPPLLDYWYVAVLVVVLVVAAATDVRRGRIYNWITYPAIALGFIGHTLAGGLAGGDGQLGLVGALLGFAVGFLPLLLAWMAGGINGGDVKLMGAVGALTGWSFALETMAFGFVVAAVMAIGVLLLRRQLFATLGRVGRFLLLSLTASRPGDPSTPQSAKIAFGLALCIGAALAALHAFLRQGTLLGS